MLLSLFQRIAGWCGSSERGQDILEYAVMTGAIALVAAAALYAAFGGGDVYETFVEKFQACLSFDGDACNPA